MVDYGKSKAVLRADSIGTDDAPLLLDMAGRAVARGRLAVPAGSG